VSESRQPPEFLRELFDQLRRRQFPLGPDDFAALRAALRAGFGWTRPELRALLCALWAKSSREQEALIALFELLAPANLGLPEPGSDETDGDTPPVLDDFQALEHDDVPPPMPVAPEVEPTAGLPPLPFGNVKVGERPFVFLPQFPLSYREIAQAWRRLRRPVREGPAVELDVDATVARRGRAGVVVPPVLVPRRRNTARLLLLVDRNGSMAPFHGFAEEVCAAIIHSGRLKHVALYYFHDAPAEGADETPLAQLAGQLAPPLDQVLPQIHPLEKGFVYEDPLLIRSRPLEKVLDADAVGADVVVISDGGAARGKYDLLRLLDTVAFLKALRAHTPRVAWLNPLPRHYWPNSTAAEIARHIPMFPLTREGIYQTVNVLRGQPHDIARPV
jgi:uncharacterized protein with von Willebrand factor type A (vWA) domain